MSLVANRPQWRTLRHSQWTFEILDQPALADRSIIYSLFIEAARTGTPLSRDAERIINYVVCHSELQVRNQTMRAGTR